MKNIHILPTDKPSRIYLIKSNNKLGITSNNPEFTENFGGGTQNQNIYITSDEEIKEKRLRFIMDNREGMCGLIHQVSVVLDSKICPEIILTTDQDLIKDGVQAIDDEFLEWFVKNPSCERVKIEKGKLQIDDDGQEYGFPDMSKYKIIIPGEEPNPFELPKALPDDVFFKSLEEPKQETLEEAAENEASIFYEKGTIEWNKYRQVFELGAKWQAERMYSEEEVKDLILKFNNDKPGIYDASEWFEQYKKK